MLDNKTFYPTMRKYHAVIGVLVTIHLAILSLSGLMLLFKGEVQHANQPIKTGIHQHEFADKYDQAYQRLLSQYKNDKPLDIYPDENNPQIIQARLGINGVNKVRGARIVNIDYQSGQEVQAKKLPYSKLYDWLLLLHHQLFLGPNGQIYIGIVGIAFILMNLTGLILFFKKRSRGLRQQAGLATYSHVHQYVGIICLWWGLLVGITGALLAFNPIFTQSFQKNTLQHLSKKYHVQYQKNQADAAFKTVIHTAFKTKPNGVIWYIVFPGMERGIQDHYLVLMHGNGMFSQFINEYLLINAKSAELKEIIHLPIFMQLALIATPVHSANYGGSLLKVIWTLFALTTLSSAILGTAIFFTRKRVIYARKS